GWRRGYAGRCSEGRTAPSLNRAVMVTCSPRRKAMGPRRSGPGRKATSGLRLGFARPMARLAGDPHRLSLARIAPGITKWEGNAMRPADTFPRIERAYYISK